MKKKRIYICRYTSSEDERKRKNPLGPVPSSVFAVARACSPFARDRICRICCQSALRSSVNSRNSRARESSLEKSFPRELFHVVIQHQIDRSVHLPGHVERDLFSCKVLFRSRRRDRFFKAATHCESGVMRRGRARKRNDDAGWSISRITAELQTLA